MAVMDGPSEAEIAQKIADDPAAAASVLCQQEDEIILLHDFLRRFHAANNRSASAMAIFQDEAATILPESK